MKSSGVSGDTYPADAALWIDPASVMFKPSAEESPETQKHSGDEEASGNDVRSVCGGGSDLLLQCSPELHPAHQQQCCSPS